MVTIVQRYLANKNTGLIGLWLDNSLRKAVSRRRNYLCKFLQLRCKILFRKKLDAIFSSPLSMRPKDKQEPADSQRSVESHPSFRHLSNESPWHLSPSFICTVQKENEEEAFQAFAHLSGVHNVWDRRKTFTEMTERSQAFRIAQAKAMVDELLVSCVQWIQGIMECCRRSAQGTSRKDKLVQITVEAYLETKTSNHKKQLLSLLAVSLSFSECQNRLLGLSKGFYHRAKEFILTYWSRSYPQLIYCKLL